MLGEMSIFSDDGGEEEERARREGSRAGIYTTAGQPADQSLVGSRSTCKNCIATFPDTPKNRAPKRSCFSGSGLCASFRALRSCRGTVPDPCRAAARGCKGAGLAATVPLVPISLAITQQETKQQKNKQNKRSLAQGPQSSDPQILNPQILNSQSSGPQS